MRSKAIVAALVLSFIGVQSVAAFNLFSTAIEEVAANPREYVGEEIRLRAEVTTVRKVPFMDVWLETVYDQTGTLIVIAEIEREVGDPFRSKVKILGIATEGAENASESLTQTVADFLVEKEIFDREQADRGAQAVVQFLRTVLPFLDTSMAAIEQE